MVVIPRIEEWLLKKIPIGTSMDETIEIIENHYWRIVSKRDSGYVVLDDRPSFANPRYNGPTPICSKSIKIMLGYYLGGIGWVEAYLGFDDDGYLVDISTVKHYSVP
jgi:hypothetical protein